MSIGYFLTDVIWMCSIGILYATYVSKYTRVSSSGRFDMSLCLNVLNSFEACGLRLTNTTCEPLDLSWCDSNPVIMDDGYTYWKKSGKTVTEFPVEANLTDIVRPFPINFTIGSVVKIRFAWHPSCFQFVTEFMDNVGNTVLHVKLNINYGRFFSSSRTVGASSWETKYGYIYADTYVTSPDVQYTLKVTRGVTGFQIYMDGVEEWEHPYDPKYEPYNIVLLDSNIKDAKGDIYQLTFRSG